MGLDQFQVQSLTLQPPNEKLRTQFHFNLIVLNSHIFKFNRKFENFINALSIGIHVLLKYVLLCLFLHFHNHIEPRQKVDAKLILMMFP